MSKAFLWQTNPLSSGVSLTFNEFCPGCPGLCTCYTAVTAFDNTDLSTISCSLDQPMVVPVEVCQKRNYQEQVVDCNSLFDKKWGDTAEKVTISGKVMLRLKTASFVTGLKIQSAHGKNEARGIGKLRIHYQTGRSEWISDQEELVTNVISLNSLEVVGRWVKDSIDLAKGVTEPIMIQFSPILTDNIHIFFLESQGDVEISVNELALYNDCKW